MIITLPKPRRRRFQFSLRTLLVLTGVVAVASLFAAREYNEWRRRERARVQRAQLLEMWDAPIPQRVR